MTTKETREKNRLFRLLKRFFPRQSEPHLYLTDSEIRTLLSRIHSNYQLTFAVDEGVWRSSCGYFRLWQGHDGRKALVFGFNYGDLDSFGKRNPLPCHAGRLYHVADWAAHEEPALQDITRAADNFTHNLTEAIARVGVLYETDAQKGLWRSGYVYYFLRTHENDASRVSAIDMGWDLDDTGLANPYGRDFAERLLRRFESRKHFSLPLGEDTQAGEGLSREQAESIMFAHFHKTLHSTLKGRHPVTARELDGRKGAFWFITLLQQARRIFRRERDPVLTGALEVNDITHHMRATTELAHVVLARVASPLAVLSGAASIFSIGKLLYKFYKHRNGHEHANPFIWHSPYKGLLGKLLRVINPETYSYGRMLSTPTFGALPPMGIKWVQNLKDWPDDLVLPATSLRIDSHVRFPMRKGVKPSQRPMENVAAIEIHRPDGISRTEILEDGRIWLHGEGARAAASDMPPPPLALRAHFRKGQVSEIKPARVVGGKPEVTHRPFAEVAQESEAAFAHNVLGALQPNGMMGGVAMGGAAPAAANDGAGAAITGGKPLLRRASGTSPLYRGSGYAMRRAGAEAADGITSDTSDASDISGAADELCGKLSLPLPPAGGVLPDGAWRNAGYAGYDWAA